jgi:predicted DNA-binding protein
MSESTNTPSTGTPANAQLRTLAVRITEDLRAQLDIIAQLTGRSTTEEIRLALEHWIDKTKSDPEVLKKAEVSRSQYNQHTVSGNCIIKSVKIAVGASPLL